MLRFPFRTPDQGLPPGDSSMRRHFVISLFVLVAAALAQPRAQAPAPRRSQPAQPAARPQPPGGRAPMISVVDPALFRGMQYRLVGPSRGGRVTAVMGVPSQPKTFYMGVASGG